MSERPKNGADPDATVMLPRDGVPPEPDPDSTVMIPPRGEDPDATVMIPPSVVPSSAPDPDATIAIPARARPAGFDPDSTVMIPADGPDPDATIAIPTPGRKREAVPPPPPPPVPAAATDAPPEIGALGGLNPLVAAANPVLAVIAQVRHALRHPDPGGLRVRLGESIAAFERNASAAGAREDAVPVASYALCCLVDESAAHTPWGADWKDHGLAAEKHAGRSGDFFSALESAMADPAAPLDLLEFFTVCLALGFEGGRPEAAAEARTKLHALLRALRPGHDGELSGHWRGIAAPLQRPRGMLGLWTAASCGALLLVLLYLAFSLSLGSMSDPVARDLAQLKLPPPAERPAPQAAAVPDVAARLAAEIGRGEVAVTDVAGQSSIVIRSDQLFASGSARIEPSIEPVVARIAAALDQVPGAIVVTGHTDDVPIRTARFPSNWELSTERAASVARLMAQKLADPKRLRAEGVADSEPLAANDSAANRARNRRVVIILRSGS